MEKEALGKYVFEPLGKINLSKSRDMVEIFSSSANAYYRNTKIKNIDSTIMFDAYMCDKLTHTNGSMIMYLENKKMTLDFLNSIINEQNDKLLEKITSTIKNMSWSVLFYSDVDYKIYEFIENKKINGKIGIYTDDKIYQTTLSNSLDKILNVSTIIIKNKHYANKIDTIIVVSEHVEYFSPNLEYFDKLCIQYTCNSIEKIINSINMLTKGGNLYLFTMNLVFSAHKYIIHALSNFFGKVCLEKNNDNSLFCTIIFSDYQGSYDDSLLTICKQLNIDIMSFNKKKSDTFPTVAEVRDNVYTSYLESSLETDTEWWREALDNFLSISTLEIIYYLEYIVMTLENDRTFKNKKIFIEERKDGFLDPVNIFYKFLYKNISGQSLLISSITKNSMENMANIKYLRKLTQSDFDKVFKEGYADIKSIFSSSFIYKNRIELKYKYIIKEILHSINVVYKFTTVMDNKQIIYNVEHTKINMAYLKYYDELDNIENTLIEILDNTSVDKIFIIRYVLFSEKDISQFIQKISEKFKHILLYRSLINILDNEAYICFCTPTHIKFDDKLKQQVSYYVNLFSKKAYDNSKMCVELDKLVTLLDDVKRPKIYDKIKEKWSDKYLNV